MKWTSDRPSESGFYWAKEDSDSEVRVVEVHSTHEVELFGREDAWNTHDFEWWSGPIPPPEEPK